MSSNPCSNHEILEFLRENLWDGPWFACDYKGRHSIPEWPFNIALASWVRVNLYMSGSLRMGHNIAIVSTPYIQQETTPILNYSLKQQGWMVLFIKVTLIFPSNIFRWT